MEKIHKKLKLYKTINFKKFINPSLADVEEYNKAMDVIPKEIEKNNELRDFEEKMYDIYNSLKAATNNYCDEIRNIAKELNPNDKEYSGKIQKVIYDIIINIVEELESAIKKFKKDKSKNYQMFEEYIIPIDNFNKEIINKIEQFISDRKDYFEEMKKYEAFLINKELGLLDNKENDNNKKEKKKKHKDKNGLNDNHTESYDKQEKYINSKNALSSYFKDIIVNINSERILIYQSLSHNCFIFHKVINEGIKSMEEILKQVDLFINQGINKCNEGMINENNIINSIIKDELYSFKFLTNDKNNINNEEESPNKKKKKDKKDKQANLNVDNLLSNINDDNILTLINNIKENKIKLNNENTDKIGIFEDRKEIERLIDLILNDPDKFDENNKKEIFNLLSSHTENHYSFMKYLNNYRSNGLFELKKKTITILCDLFTLIVERAIKNNDFRIIQYSFILSLTYCHLEEENKNDTNKIYMSKYLKNTKPFHEKNFWTNYFQSLIIDEEEKIAQRNNFKIDDKKKSVIIYSNIFTLLKNMIDYDLEFNFINEILQEIFSKNTFSDQEKSELVNYLMSEIEQKNKK